MVARTRATAPSVYQSGVQGDSKMRAISRKIPTVWTTNPTPIGQIQIRACRSRARMPRNRKPRAINTGHSQ